MGVILRPIEPIGRPFVPRGISSGRSLTERSAVFAITDKSPTKTQVREWLSVQIPYPNLAEDPFVHDRALQYVQAQKRYYNDRTTDVRDKWRSLNYVLRGSSLSQRFAASDIHVPELYKMVETIVPRIEEAIFAQDPWFFTKGRDRSDKRRAWKVRAWLDYLLDDAGLDNDQQEFIRTMLVYGFFAVKSWWEIKFEKRIVRKVEKMPSKDGMGRHRITASEEETLVTYAPRHMLVDPYDFMVDVWNTSAQKGLWVGDSSEVRLADLQQEQSLGLAVNVDNVRNETPQDYDGTDRRWSKYQRSLAQPLGASDARVHEGEPPKFEQDEIWAFWDPYGDGHPEEYKIRVVNQSTVVEVRRNPYDDKHRPYAVGRCSREPFDFHNVGPLDHALRLEIEINDHRNLASMSHANALCPTIFARDTDELPPNIFTVEPGEVLRTSSKPDFILPPSTVETMVAMEEIVRRDIEEVTGAPRIYEGQGSEGETATGIVRKIEEGNRRLRGYIRAYSSGLEDLVKHYHALSAQFTTRRETFRVLGRAAANGQLGPYSEIGPEDMQIPMDVEVVGLRSAHTIGLRATNIATFLTQIYPVAAQFVPPDSVDWLRMLDQLWEMSVGTVPGEEIFRLSETSLEDLIPPEEENLLMAQGVELVPLEGDQDQRHVKVHQQALPDMDEDSQALVYRHIEMHMVQFGKKRERQQRAAEKAQQAQILSGQGSASAMSPAGRGRSGQAGDFNRQGSETPPGETPGPPRMGSIPSADRQRPLPQGENQGNNGLS